MIIGKKIGDSGRLTIEGFRRDTGYCDCRKKEVTLGYRKVERRDKRGERQ